MSFIVVSLIHEMSARFAIHSLILSEGISPGTRLSNDLLDRISKDWESFREQAEALGFDAVEHRATMIDPRQEADEWELAAQDFVYTRNRHGHGFWCGDWHQPWGERLTTLAHSFPQVETYLDDDDILRIL
jgi:hypothetical protein